jgi:GT2 family glycosyltransferase
VRVDGKFFARGGRRLRVHGVTYGPFAPNADGQPFPSTERVAGDFGHMQAAGINAVRTYHVPPAWFLHLADQCPMQVFLDVPWGKHLCFLDSDEAQREARECVRRAAKLAQRHPSVLACSVANEIPPAIVRWHGVRRVEHFLRELTDVVKQADPDRLVTYTSYPPTEYLGLAFLDFITFNIYLHDRETFHRYLLRLQNLVADKPLVLGELGMDTLRHGEVGQADFLAGHVREARLVGLAGTFVFSWTDDWHTGGHPVQDWAFGITHADRLPKPSYHALREVFEAPAPALLPETPTVSVVVCTYNGGPTLAQCLQSLRALDYPDYEVIVVDDGSTDGTPAILARFPEVRVVRQPNRGLSVARNAGLQAARGAILAYTDSDCFADADWLTHLVHHLQRTGADAVGGPNLTPPDGWLAACVAASPGQPAHVLESDQVAEHIPGCNMAFRREALVAVNGFDPQYRKAGDDVDVCWRLQQAGRWITFAPGAFVWHHRRQTPRAYLRQQAGYGEAEALLLFKHPDKFNGRGDGKWRGVLYGVSLQGVRLGGPVIYHGTFGTALFQCVYQPGPAHWAMLPGTLEWHLAAGLVALTAFLWPPGWAVVPAMLALSLAVAVVQATQARLEPGHEGLASRALIAALCYAQPLVRSWARYRTRLLSPNRPRPDPALAPGYPERLPFSGRHTVAYWSEEGRGRVQLLDSVVAFLNERCWGKVLDSGWCNWDLEVYCHPWATVRVRTTEEDHGGAKRLVRVHYCQRLRGNAKLLGVAGVLGAVGLTAVHVALGAGFAVALAAGMAGMWWHGNRMTRLVAGAIDTVARRMNFVR